MKSNKFWMILFGALLVVSGVATFLMIDMPQAVYAQIFIDGALVETINLSAVSETKDIVSHGEGRYVRIVAEPGRIAIVETNCYLQLCKRQGWRNSGVIPIVCLPNRVAIRFTSANLPDIDGVVG
ncbi:MAG: NusG domain II-containing protein [Oscillospiraceae bacterium]|nr:NusG domain II-containing protein [Oscillospiraceae bacterium]MCL2279651.1 NusG domain II-containing protein [Oscillospiraceae bacterium]